MRRSERGLLFRRMKGMIGYIASAHDCTILMYVQLLFVDGDGLLTPLCRQRMMLACDKSACNFAFSSTRC